MKWKEKKNTYKWYSFQCHDTIVIKNRTMVERKYHRPAPDNVHYDNNFVLLHGNVPGQPYPKVVNYIEFLNIFNKKKNVQLIFN